MPESQTKPITPERAPIDTLLPYLRSRPESNVKELIARNLATGVFHDNPEEVLYWTAIHAALSDRPVRAALLSDVLDHLGRIAINSS